MDPTRIRGLVFDLYGTLLSLASIEAASGRVCGDGRGFAELWRTKQLQYAVARGAMDRYEDFWAVTEAALEFTAERFGVLLEEEHRRELMGAWQALDAQPDVREAIGRLDPKPLAVLSNGSPAMLEAALAHSGLGSLFRHVISADEVRTYKPSPQVYALGPERLGFSPEELLFVSSQGFDAAGAKAFGYTVCWLNRTRAPAERLGLAPDLAVSAFGEIADWLGL